MIFEESKTAAHFTTISLYMNTKILAHTLLITTLSLLALSSCKEEGATPTPPSLLPTSSRLIASMKVTRYHEVGSGAFVERMDYRYDDQGRVVWMQYYDGKHPHNSTVTYSDGLITVLSPEDGDREKFRADGSGRILKYLDSDDTETNLTYDSGGRLLEMELEELTYRYKWGSDRLLERKATAADEIDVPLYTEYYSYSHLKDQVGLTFLYIPWIKVLPVAWLGTASGYLPTKVERKAGLIGGLMTQTVTYSYEMDERGRPIQITMVGDLDLLGHTDREVSRMTIDLTYVER